jgi:hypothetical protein
VTLLRTLELLAKERIHDLVVVAVHDGSDPDSVADAMGEVYLQLDHGYLRFASVNNHGGLQVRHVDAIDLGAFRDEFGLDAFPVRLGNLFLGESRTVECLQVDYVTNEESDLDHGIVRSAEFVLSHGHRVLFDPMYTWGVRVGNTDPWPQAIMSGPWTFQRHTWVRP